MPVAALALALLGSAADMAPHCISADVAAAVSPVHFCGQFVCNLRSLGQILQGRVPSGSFISAEVCCGLSAELR